MKRRIIISEKELGRLFKFSERKVRDLFIDARIRAGTYDMRDCLEIFIANQEIKNIDLEIKELDKQTKEFKLQILQGEYHKVEDVTMAVSDMIANFKSKVTSIPTKLSQELIGVDNRLKAEEILRNGINEALLELTEYKIDLDKGAEDEESDY